MTTSYKPRGSRPMRGSKQHKKRYLHTTPLIIFLLVFVVVGFSLVVYASLANSDNTPATLAHTDNPQSLTALQLQNQALQERIAHIHDSVSHMDYHLATLSGLAVLSTAPTEPFTTADTTPTDYLYDYLLDMPTAEHYTHENEPSHSADTPFYTPNSSVLDDAPMYQIEQDKQPYADYEPWSYVPDHSITLIAQSNREQVAQNNPLPTPQQISEQLSHVSSLFPSHTVHPYVTWDTARNLLPRYDNATIIDVLTGQTFRIQRTFGTNHADIETLTQADSQVVYGLWGGHSWAVRAVIVVTDSGHIMPASMNGYPHAGVDGLPPIQVVENRSGGFGRGQNLNLIQGNGISGHFCLHFSGSMTHGSRRVHAGHQEQVGIARAFLAHQF